MALAMKKTIFAFALAGLSLAGYWGFNRADIGIGIPVEKSVVYSEEERDSWTIGYYPQVEPAIARAQQRIVEWGLADTSDPVQKIAQLVDGIAKGIFRGEPAPHLTKLDGLALYESSAEKQEPIWCHQIAKIYVAYANLAHLPSRLVHIAGKGEDGRLAGHAFAETWDPNARTWLFVDPSTEIALVVDSDEVGQRALDVVTHYRTAEIPGWQVVHRGEMVPFSSIRHHYRDYFQPGMVLVYPKPTHERLTGIAKLAFLYLQPKQVVTENPQRLENGERIRLASLVCFIISSVLIAISCAIKLTKRREVDE
jgi:hypothetical protein